MAPRAETVGWSHEGGQRICYWIWQHRVTGGNLRVAVSERRGFSSQVQWDKKQAGMGENGDCSPSQ